MKTSIEQNQLSFSEEDIKNVARYIELLAKVKIRYQSVSIIQPTSTSVPDVICSGFIDKVIIKLCRSMSVSNLRKGCEELGYSIEGSYKEKNRYFLTVNSSIIQIDCFLGSPKRRSFFEISFNPAQTHFFLIENEFIKLFGIDAIEARVYRTDFTYDRREEYKSVLRGLDIKWKRVNAKFMNKSIETGFVVGGKFDKFLIYNKALQMGVNEPWTRIERQMSGSKVIFKTFGELCRGKDKIIQFDPFGTVTLNRISVQKKEGANSDQNERYYEIKSLIDHLGYFWTRKQLSSKNYIRDYECFITKVPYAVQPSEIFNRDILNFFEEKLFQERVIH